MEKKSQDFSMQEALRLAKSPAGQQLLAMLRQADSGQLQQAIHQANAGEYDRAQQTLQALLDDPQIHSLLQQLGGK